jgi:hypothetical protein
MCMLFILWKAHGGYEHRIRGVQRLLCTLLCTRSNPYGNPVDPSADARTANISSSPLMIVRPFSANEMEA